MNLETRRLRLLAKREQLAGKEDLLRTLELQPDRNLADVADLKRRINEIRQQLTVMSTIITNDYL